MTSALPVRKIAAEYLSTMDTLLKALALDDVERAVDCLRAARDGGRTIFIAGNGGSAATAAHLTNDLGKATQIAGRPRIRVMCLSDNTPWFSALANDEGYDRVFAGQLENFASQGDVLIVISASGNSQNLIEAVKVADDAGMTTVGLLGFDGGRLLDIVDIALWTETEPGLYGPVESVHSVVADILTTALIRDRREQLGATAS